MSKETPIKAAGSFLFPHGMISFIAIALTSCCTKPPSGQIYLDRPEVFTRERLVNRRLADLQWLEGELNRPVTSTLQGAREQRSFSGLTVQGQVQFDPLAAASALGARQSAQGTQHIAQIQNNLVATAYEQKLKDLQSGKIKYSDVLGTNPVSVAGAPQGVGGFSPTNPSTSLDSAFTNPSNLPNLPSASNLVFVSSQVQLTAQEQFRDRLAYRDAVSAVMREKELDDTHDRAGMTLYTFKFDLSVIPGVENSRLGRAGVSFVKGEDRSTAAEQYTNWVQAVRRTFDKEVISIQRRYLQKYLTDEEQRKLTVLCWAVRDQYPALKRLDREKLQSILKSSQADLDKTKQSRWQLIEQVQALESGSEKYGKIKGQIETTSFEVDKKANDLAELEGVLDLVEFPSALQASPTNDEVVLRTLSRLVAAGFAEALRDKTNGALLAFGDPQPAYDEDGSRLFMIPVLTRANVEAAFTNLVAVLDTNATPFVYTVEPKEAAQNLSDVSSRETVRNLSLSLAAAIPNIGTRASAYLNYIKRYQSMVETIKRKPLLVGYIEDRKEFGWIIGPRFSIDKDLNLNYEHTTLQQAVQATIAVPSWWASVAFRTKGGWLNDRARHYEDTEVTRASYTVRLRPDYDALTRALLERADPTFAQPQIYPRWDRDQKKRGYVLRAGRPAQLLILGRNLWRNPEIFIGSQATRKFEVVPDMQGLVAIFDEVTPPQTMDSTEEAPQVDLRVVTSDGEAVLKNAVTIISGQRPGSLSPFFNLIDNFAVTSANVAFAANADQAPERFADFELYLYTRSIDPMSWATNSAIDNGRLNFLMPGNSGLWASPIKALVDVRARLSPLARPVSVLEGGTQDFVIFTNLSQTMFRITNSSLAISINAPAFTNVTVLLPDLAGHSDLFWDARPGLSSNPAYLQLTANNATNILGPVTLDRTLASFVFPINITNTAAVFGIRGTNPVTCSATILAPSTDAPRWRVPAGTVTLTGK